MPLDLLTLDQAVKDAAEKTGYEVRSVTERVEITDALLLDSELWVRRPDYERIARLIRLGANVPGARLVPVHEYRFQLKPEAAAS